MGAWTTAASAVADLRRFLNDGPADRPIKDKALVGRVDGLNRRFQTYEDRIVDGTFQALVNQESVTSAAVDLVMGLFDLTVAPAEGTQVRARYYYQLFTDDDLVEALQLASGEIVENDNVTLVETGLKSAALNIAKGHAFGKQAIRWADLMSQRFLLEDAPLDSQPQGRPNLFQQISRDATRLGLELRTSFYTSHSRRNVPAFAVTKPFIRFPVGPRR